MFDDLDDLLEDNPKPSGYKPTGNTSLSSKNMSKIPAPTTFGSKKKDDLDDLDFLDQPKGGSGLKKQQDKMGSNSKFNASLGSFGAPKREEKKDEWGEWGLEDKPVQKSLGTISKDEPRSSGGSYTGFGLLGKQKPQERPATSSTFQNKNKRDDDDIDSILEGLAKEKKVEIEKPQERRPATSDARQPWGMGQQQQKSKFKSSLDPWERDNFDELEDNEDKKSKVSAQPIGRGRERESNHQSREMQEKRNALFGLQPTNPVDNSSQVKGNTTSKSLGRIPDKDAPLFTSYNLGPQDPNMMGTIGNLSQSQESQIETLDVGNSRSRQMRKLPQRMASGQEQPKTQSMGRPPTGGALYNQQSGIPQFQLQGDNRVQTSPIGMAQQNFPSQNFQIAPLQRPQTGIQYGKPPKGGYSGVQEEEEGHILDLLDQQKDRSYKGSVGSGGQGVPAFYASIEQDDQQFERFDEGGDDEEHSPRESDNSDAIGGGYLPTAIQKAAPESKKQQHSKNSSKQKIKAQNSFAGSGLGGYDGGLSEKDKRQQTIHSDNESKPKSEYQSQIFLSKQNTQQQPVLLNQAMNSIGSQGTIQTSPILIQNNSLPIQSSPPVQQPILDEKSLIQKQIEEERYKIKMAEEKHRKVLDELREENKRQMKILDDNQSYKLTSYNEQKRKLIDDMNKTIELEKEKLSNLHRIDLENREIQYKKNLENQRSLYEEQNESLKKQLQQQVQMNSFAQDIQKSSGSINQLVNKMSAEQEGDLKRREDELLRKEKAYQDKKKMLAERRQQIELRKKKLEMEQDEVEHKLSESRLDYEREKQEITTEIDQIEIDHQQSIREIRNKNIELEVEIRRTRAEREKIVYSVSQEDREGEEMVEQLIQQKKQLVIEREDFRNEVTESEKELKHKLREIREREKEIDDDERIFQEKQKQFEYETKKVQEDHEKLQDQLDKYCYDRQVFDMEGEKVKEQGERDQLDSEKVGFFKSNKERLKDELRQLREELEAERDAMREDRIKLNMYKNELKTRQKTIESMRYEYIKSGPDSQHKFLDDARDIGYYNIQRESAQKQTFYPINPPKFDMQHDPISQSKSFSYNQRGVNSSLQMEQRSKPSNPTYVPRFKYDEYMRNLNEKLNNCAPITSKLSSDFQLYVMKEREAYLKGLNDYDLDQPLIQSISQFKSYHKQGEEGNEASPFNIGSLQNSQYKKGVAGLTSSQYGKNSTNSLHFISKNFSNTPVEEVDRDKEESHMYL